MDIKYPFKAIFLCGGPGSGKSHVAETMFSGLGFKFSSIDYVLKYLAKKTGGEPDLRQFYNQSSLYNKAADLLKKRNSLWQSSGFPFVLDITGRDVALVKQLKNQVEQAGYDSFMLYVSTSLETAIERNNQRQNIPNGHVVDQEFLKTAWQDAKRNVPVYRSIFDQNFVRVGNDKEMDNNKVIELHRLGSQIANLPVKNPIGREQTPPPKGRIVEPKFRRPTPTWGHPPVASLVGSKDLEDDQTS